MARRRSVAPSGRATSTPGDFQLIEDSAAFDAWLVNMAGVDLFALDTEFHRERTYFPKLALIQIAWGDPVQIVLLDPLAVDLAPLGQLFGDGVEVVMHAAAQDLEVLELACGCVPATVFDTQLAAGFLGLGLPSLSELHERELGTALPKGDRLTDWLRRPLGDDQLRYAAADVSDLLEIHGRLTERLDGLGRLEWAAAECEQLRRRVHASRDPEEAWSRLREVRQLRGRSLAVAKEVAAWRERRAAKVDLPSRFVLPDLAVAGVSQRAPQTEEDLRKVRGIEDRFVRGESGAELLEAVRRGLSAPEPTGTPPPRAEVPKELRAAVSLLTAWVAQRARDLGIDASLLATRSDLEDLLRGDSDARLATGWRGDLVGAQIKDLVAGRASLAFDGRGGLLLEPRSIDD